jgi:hypothetical protein
MNSTESRRNKGAFPSRSAKKTRDAVSGRSPTNIKVIDRLPDLEAVRSFWETWQNHANNDLEQFHLVCRLRPEVECPFVTVLEWNHQPRVLLIGRLERTRFAPVIGYLKPWKLSARIIAVIHRGEIGRLGDEEARECIHYLRSLLSAGAADAVQFHYLSEHSALLQALLASGSPWFCEKKSGWSIHREMTVPAEGKFMECRVSSKHRTRLHKKQEELEAAFPNRVSWRWMSRFDDIPLLCARLEEVAARTYQRGLGGGFFDNEEFRQRFALFAGRDLLRVQLLEIDGDIRAFWFGFVYQDVFHSSETGYDPELRDYEVGTQMFMRMADELAREGIRKLDFGLGDAHYKQRFGDRSWRETTIWLFAPTVRGLGLRSMLGASILLDRAARQVLQKMGLTDRLKTFWRKRLARRKKDEKASA